MALSSLALLLAPLSVRAESAIYVGCYRPASIDPQSGTTIPANLPAFVFAPDRLSFVPRIPTIEDYAIEVRSGTSQIEVPVSIEAGPNEQYLIKPKNLMPVGSLTVSYLSWCDPRDVDAGTDGSKRRVSHSYEVASPVVLPSTPLTAELRKTSYFVIPGSACDRPSSASADVEVILPSSLRGFPLGQARALVRDKSYQLFSYAGIVADRMGFMLTGSCVGLFDEPLVAGSNSVVLEIAIPGSPAGLRTSPIDIAIDCSVRPAGTGAPFCSSTPPIPDGGPIDMTVSTRPDTGCIETPTSTPTSDGGTAWVYGQYPAEDGGAPDSTNSPQPKPVEKERPASKDSGCSLAPNASSAGAMVSLGLFVVLVLARRRRLANTPQ